jgi:hypothetical protein
VVIKPGQRFLFTHRGEGVEYVVFSTETDGTLNPRSRIVRLARAGVDPTDGPYASVTEHWLRIGPPGYSGYWTFLAGS